MKKLIIAIIIINIAILSAQTKQVGPAEIRGTVIDSLSGKAIPFATITLLKADDSSIISGDLSNEEGKFEIEKLPYGSYTLKAGFIGYNNTFIRNIKLSKEQKMIILSSLSLMPVSVETDEITVEAEQDLVTYEVDKKVVNVNKHINAKGGMAADVLENIPSVQVDVEGNVALRGSQNFTVLIDGKPTVLSNQEALKQIPAEMIENIEIITNPSAKYDPDGTAGILNLVLKKEKLAGMNGLISLSAGSRDKYNGSSNFNFRNDKFNFFTNVNYNDRKFHPSSDFLKSVDLGQITTFANPYMDRYMISSGYSVRLGTDYNIDDKNTLSFSGTFGDNGFERYYPADYREWSIDNQTNQEESFLETRTNDVFILGGNWGNANVNYHMKLSEVKDHDIMLNASFQRWDGDISQLHEKRYKNSNWIRFPQILNSHRTYNDGERNDVNVRLDYSQPISNTSKLEAGFHSSIVAKRFDFLFEDLNIGTNQWVTNNNYTNITEFDQSINAAYATYANRFWNIGYNFGLRAEYYTRNLQQITLQESFGRDRINLFPTAHLSYNLKQGMDLQVSYSRRVQRPDDRALNPFPDYSDSDYISRGNPDLNSQFTNSLELNYRYSFAKSFISLESYFRQTDDLIAQVFIPYDDDKILITSQNMNEDFLYGTQLAINSNPLKWMRFYVAMNYYRYTLDQTRNGANFTRTTNIFDLAGNITFTLTPSTFVQLSGNYSGEKLTADGRQLPLYAVNGTVRKDFLNRKITAVLNIRDIFSTAVYEFRSDVLNFSTRGYFRPEQPVINLTLSYRINNYQRRNDDDVNIDFQNGI